MVDVENIPEWLSQEMRVFNVFLRRGPLTLSEVGRQLGMNLPAVFNHAIRLCAEGCLTECGRVKTRGRSATVYDIHGRA